MFVLIHIKRIWYNDSVALQASTTYAPKHLISLLYNSFDEYVFIEKANFYQSLAINTIIKTIQLQYMK